MPTDNWVLLALKVHSFQFCLSQNLISVSCELHVASKGRQTNKKATLPAKRKQKTAESDEDFVVSGDEEEKHLEKTKKTKNTSKKRTSNSIDDSDEDITPTASKRAKRKSREIQSDSDDDYEPVRPEKSKPVKPVSRDVSSGSDEEDVKPPPKVGKAGPSLIKCEDKIYILLTKRGGRTGRISARGLEKKKKKKTKGLYSPSTVPSKLG